MNHWRWDPRTFNQEFQRASEDEYLNCLNEGTKQAIEAQWDLLMELIQGLHGVVLDVATGLGRLFNRLLCAQGDFLPIATDIDPNVLEWMIRQARGRYSRPFYAVATDGRHMAFVDETFDFVLSYAGIQNIPDPQRVIREVHRVLKPGGRLIMMSSFVNEGTDTHRLAQQYGLERAFVKQYMLEDLSQAGFEQIDDQVVGFAVWDHNPQDLLPIGGDTQYYAVIQAKKPIKGHSYLVSI